MIFSDGKPCMVLHISVANAYIIAIIGSGVLLNQPHAKLLNQVHEG